MRVHTMPASPAPGRRFQALHDRLLTIPGNEVVLTLEEMEDIIGVPLAGAAHHRSYWDKSLTASQNIRWTWVDAGFDAALLPDRTTVRFVRASR